MEVARVGGPYSPVYSMDDMSFEAPKKEKSEIRQLFDKAVKSVKEGHIGKGIKYAKEGVDVFMKGIKLTKSVTGVVEEFTSIPFVLGEIFFWTGPIKIAKGLTSVPKLYKSAVKLIKADNWKDRVSHVWDMIKSTKNIVGSIEGLGKILKTYKAIPKIAMVWTRFTGYIFLPVGFIDTGISIYKLHKRVTMMRDFNKQTKVSKDASQPTQQLESMKRAITYVQSAAKTLEKGDIVNEKCDLDGRMTKIFKRLQSENAVERQEAFDEGKMVISKLKDRIKAHVVSDAIDTSLSIIGSVMTIVGLANPVLTLPAAIIDLACATASTANYIHSRVIPSGEIKADEFTSPYTVTFKAVKSVKKDVTRALDGFVRDIGHSLERLGQKMQRAAAAA